MARLLILGAGVFGELAAVEARRLGHEPVVVHRGGRLRTDASDARSVAATLATVRPDAVVNTAGPAARLEPGAAKAAQARGLPYVDLAEDGGFRMKVRALGDGVPLLPGMSTTPALAEALASILLARAKDAAALRCVLLSQGGNAPGRATLSYAARTRVRGGAATVEVPHLGAVRAYPARGEFAPPTSIATRFYVGLTGLAGIGWRLARIPGVALLGRFAPALGGTAGALVVDALDEDGFVLAREGLAAPERAQRMAVLPAHWAVAEALAGRAPMRAALPAEWVDAETLVDYVERAGFERLVV